MNNYKGLYIHIPFCIKKCKYCDFVSFTDKADFFDTYIDKLLNEATEYSGEKIDTVFIGGGTPSVLSAKQLKKLLVGITSIFELTDNLEFTIEINPKTLDEEKLRVLKDFGVNRLSVGIQSFCDEELKAIGRIHDAKTAYNTVELIKNYGFDNFNIDIMLGLPNQTKESLEHTLKTALSLNPTHISCYSLILEENTPLFSEYENGVYPYITDEEDRELYSFTKAILKNNNYEQYEISNFAKRGYCSKHNLKYWNCDEYIGLGVAAHSYINGTRFYNTSCFTEYLNGNYHTDEKSILEAEDKISEYIIMRLRLSDGINEIDFYERFKKDFYDLYKNQIDNFIKSGFIKYENKSYKLTDKGIDVSNSIMCEFVWFFADFISFYEQFVKLNQKGLDNSL